METPIQSPLNEVSEIQLTYNPVIKPSQRPKIEQSIDVYTLLINNWDLGKIDFIEQFKILLLNRANKVLGIMDVSTGGVSGTVADPKIIFSAALKANASVIILSHNHPSGNLRPSQSDLDLTRKLIAAGNYLDIHVIEHIIITSEGYLSFVDQGLL